MNSTTPGPFSLTWLPEPLQAAWAQTLIGLLVLGAVSLSLQFIARHYLLLGLSALVVRTRIAWDQILFENKVLHRASVMIPLVAIQLGIPLVPGLSDDAAGLILRITSAGMILVVVRTVDAFLSALHQIYLGMPASGTRPIKSYLQLTKIVVYLIGAIFIVARLADQSPWYFVSGLGAVMAIILLVFRDTLLSLVAGIQLTNNDLLRVGDWIEMPAFGADGDVVDIALNTVKVQNWDKTVSIIPTYKFTETGFKNWRSMFESGGRRIKRAIRIDTSTIRFLSEEEIERFSRFALLQDYMAQKVRELTEHNARYGFDPALIPNARRLTNVGTFRAYIAAYLKSHPGIHQDLTFLVRQLEPTPEGLPIEIYVFTNNTRWADYEAIQGDIFDHILAMATEFGLHIYQRPAGTDLTAVPAPLTASV